MALKSGRRKEDVLVGAAGGKRSVSKRAESIKGGGFAIDDSVSNAKSLSFRQCWL